MNILKGEQTADFKVWLFEMDEFQKKANAAEPLFAKFEKGALRQVGRFRYFEPTLGVKCLERSN